MPCYVSSLVLVSLTYNLGCWVPTTITAEDNEVPSRSANENDRGKKKTMF